MRVSAICVLFSALVAVCPGQDQESVQWLRDHAIALDTVKAGSGFADMEPLRQVVGDAHIVSLGEATHGTREFFQMKHRMLEFLATEMGFNIFSIEANMPEAYCLNDFVLNGAGDPKKLLAGMYFWTWNTEEVLDMILWMREFNASGKGRLQFTGFDMQTPTVAMQIAGDFLAGADPTEYQRMNTVYTQMSAQSSGFGVATASFPVAAARGRQFRFSGYIRTQDIQRGYAGLWARIDGPSGMLTLDNMSGRGVRGTKDWARYDIVFDVPQQATAIYFGALHPGDGTAWFDSFAVELNGIRYTDTSGFDLGFETNPPRGFYTGGQGYSVTVDPTVAHTGKQSLRSRYLGPSASEMAAQCGAIVADMEASRDAYLAGGYSEWDVDWATQNARIVYQAAKLVLDSGVRDPAMADNIKWILDHNPGAKIVLWAHNMHVSPDGYPDYHNSMGLNLRRMYGADMVVFGFGFNQGSFQAIDMAGGGLKPFTVSPAPPDSLDGAFAATGIPILAVDLRPALASGVPGWLCSPQPARTIGAGYSASYASYYFYPLNAASGYDGMFFIETTTRAVPVSSQ